MTEKNCPNCIKPYKYFLLLKAPGNGAMPFCFDGCDVKCDIGSLLSIRTATKYKWIGPQIELNEYQQIFFEQDSAGNFFPTKKVERHRAANMWPVDSGNRMSITEYLERNSKPGFGFLRD